MDCIWYNGLYTCTRRLFKPRVGSRQASQNKLIWPYNTVLFVVKWRQHDELYAL